jgi:hypothetical protein
VIPPIAKTPSSEQTALAAAGNLLPVPNSNAPIGNTGNRADVKVFGHPEGDSSSPPIPPNMAGLLGVRYRVVVDAGDNDQQTQVRTVVPDAFLTSLKGRKVFQVGAFGDRDKADQLVQTLASQGLRATVEMAE